ncbi:MAG: glycosyl hydrolase 108 family protein [Janthinobacterium lividum]
MTAGTFLPTALPFTLASEGYGYTNDPRDLGGSTDDGVTLGAWRTWTGNPKATVAELRAMTVTQRTAFYRSLWDRVRGDDLPAGVDLFTFDGTVNTGTNAARQLQRVVGLAGLACDGEVGEQTLAAIARADAAGLALRLKGGPAGGVAMLQAGLGLREDGQMGPITLTAARAHRDATLTAALYDQAVGYYWTCAGFQTYGAGWLARAKRRATLAMRLAVPAGVLQAPIS